MNLGYCSYLKLWKPEEYAMINILLAGLISADTIITKQDAIHSKNELIKIQEALEQAKDIREYKKFKEIINTCIEICDKDIKNFEDEEKHK